VSKIINVRLHKTIILPVVLYGCENFSLTLKGEHGLRVFENRALRRIFGPKYNQSDQVKEDDRGKAPMRQTVNSCRIFVGKLED
jgi:hypothetical protein